MVRRQHAKALSSVMAAITPNHDGLLKTGTPHVEFL